MDKRAIPLLCRHTPGSIFVSEVDWCWFNINLNIQISIERQIIHVSKNQLIQYQSTSTFFILIALKSNTKIHWKIKLLISRWCLNPAMWKQNVLRKTTVTKFKTWCSRPIPNNWRTGTSQEPTHNFMLWF